MITSLPENKIPEIVNAIEQDLLTQTKRSFGLGSEWKEQFPEKSGVYAIFEDSKLIYIGETAELQARMREIRRTYNHTLRKKIGKFRFSENLIGNKFSEEIESKLDMYMCEHLTIAFHALSFGRTEVESKLVEKYKDQLINSPSLRGKPKK